MNDDVTTSSDMTLFDLPPLDPGYLSIKPKLSADARRTQQSRHLLARGIHPATRASLLDPEWGYHCLDCAHAHRVNGRTRSYWKCDLHQLGMSRSAASDIRIGWPACALLRIAGGAP